MQKALQAVKHPLSLICLITLVSCSPLRKKSNTPDQVTLLTDEASPHPDYVAQNLRYAPFEARRQKIEKKIGQTLKNRGEAHITVITPPEWKVLSEKIQMSEVDELAKKSNLQKTAFEPVCLGQGEKHLDSKKAQTYFVVVRSPGLLQFRNLIKKLYVSRQGRQPFSADHFYPHVTLGFTDTDLHENDGVIKNEEACIEPWSAL